MSNEAKHSPLPWGWQHDEIGDSLNGVRRSEFPIFNVSGKFSHIATATTHDDAELIVRAVNSYEALVAACEAALDFCNDIGDGAPDAGPVERTANTLTVQLHNALDKAKATGGAA